MMAGSDPSEWCLSSEALSADRGLGPLLRTWAAHDDVRFRGDLRQMAILGIHCDGVSYTTNLRAGGARSILIASMNVVSSPRDKRRNHRQPLFVIRKARLCGCGCGGYHTLQVLFEVVAWSLRCLLVGQSPTTRHDGTPFTAEDLESRVQGGERIPHACLLQIRGDWEWLAQCFRLRSIHCISQLPSFDTTLKNKTPNMLNSVLPHVVEKIGDV